MIVNTSKIREINKQLIRNELRSCDFSTKHTISLATGLSVASCTNILREMISESEVIEVEHAESTGGRPSKQFQYNNDYAYVCLIYARQEDEKRTLNIVISDMKSNEIYSEERIFQDIEYSDIKLFISEMIDKYKNIKVISVGIPGVVNKGIIGICDYIKLTGIDIETELKESFGLDVIATNDMNATALGYYFKEQLKDIEAFVYLYFPKNGIPGSGIIINGHILYGNSHFAGEVSFLALKENRDNHGNLQENKGKFTLLVSEMLRSIISLINPKLVVLSGESFKNIDNSKILDKLPDSIDIDHFPELLFEDDIHESYIEGLKFIAMNRLGCDLELVKR